MLPVNGFYGHVRSNNLRSAVMFLGFLVAFHLVAALALTLPLFFYDAGHAWFARPYGYLLRYVPFVSAFAAVLFLVQFLFHVAAVRSTLAFKGVEQWTHPRLFRIVATQAITAGLPQPRIGLIDSPALNALACGLGARSAVIVVTSGLVEALDDDELAAVVGHEISHIKHGDIRLMAAANVLLGNVQWMQRQNPLRVVDFKQVILMILMPPFLLLFAAAAAVTWVSSRIARVSRRLISTSREFVADAEAVRMTHNPSALISALQRIEGRSTIPGVSAQADAMMIDGAVAGAFASHPSIADRVAVLTRLSGAMAHVAAPRKDTRGMDLRGIDRPQALNGAARSAHAATTLPLWSSRVSRIAELLRSGAGSRLFGLSPRLLRLMLVVVVFAFSSQVSALLRFLPNIDPDSARSIPFIGKELAPLLDVMSGKAFKEINSANWSYNRLSGDAFVIKPGPAAWNDLQGLALQSPIRARCFNTDYYKVGDRGLHMVTMPDPRLVEEFSTGAAHDYPEIQLERYLGIQLKSVRAVADAQQGQLDAALLSYVESRKLMLMTVHRFFGKHGLRLMQEAYDSLANHVVLNTIQRRLGERALALVGNQQAVAEIQFLLATPQDFIPCAARTL